MITKKAICIGSNYTHHDRELQGGVGDAEAFAIMLEKNGYDVVRLLGGKATRTNILTALTVAIASMRGDHQLVVTFSGYGTWVPEVNRDSEGVMRVRAICPDDYDDSQAITGKDLKDLFLVAPKRSRVLFIDDSAHENAKATSLVGSVSPDKLKYAPATPPPGSILSNKSMSSLESAVPLSKWDVGAPVISGGVDGRSVHERRTGLVTSGILSSVAIRTHTPGIRLAAWERNMTERLFAEGGYQIPELTTGNWLERFRKAL